MARFLFFGVLHLFVVFAAQALVEEGPIGFKLWKDSQFVEAKNKVARLSNQLTIIKRQISLDADDSVSTSLKQDSGSAEKTKKSDKEEGAELLPSMKKEMLSSADSLDKDKLEAHGGPDNSKRTQFQQQQIEQLEMELKRALENLQFVADLTLEDYFAVYLSKYSEDPEAIQKVAKDLTSQEVEQLLKLILKKNLDEATKIQTMRGPLERRDAGPTPL